MARLRGGRPDIFEFEEDLGFPRGFTSLEPDDSAAVRSVILLRRQHPSRTFLTGVILAFVAMAEDLAAATGSEGNTDALSLFPPQTIRNNKTVNTLTIEGPNGAISLRPYYMKVENVARHWLMRTEYPNAAPHATGQWAQHKQEYELICAMTRRERLAVALAMWGELLDLREFEKPSSESRSIRPFELIIRLFPSAHGEPGGAVMQAFAYAYYRADSPGLTLITAKVGSGSSRRPNSVADVDGWDGARLQLSVEVKDLDITDENLDQFDQFIFNLKRWPDATAVALARSFSSGAISFLSDHRILVFDRERMAQNVSYWDLNKQRAATRAVDHYFDVIQGHSGLSERFDRFCTANEINY